VKQIPEHGVRLSNAKRRSGGTQYTQSVKRLRPHGGAAYSAVNVLLFTAVQALPASSPSITALEQYPILPPCKLKSQEGLNNTQKVAILAGAPPCTLLSL